MTLADAIEGVADVLEAHGFALPTTVIKAIIAELRPELVVIEAPVVMVEIAPGVFGRDAAPMPPPPTKPGAMEGYYRKKSVQPMRPYVPGEDLTGVSVSAGDNPEEGGMIACNPANPADKWYVAKDFFAANYVPAGIVYPRSDA